MKTIQLSLVLLTFLCVSLFSLPAQAVCDGDFSTLISAINNATYKNPEKDRTALLGKAVDAWSKANAGKTSDAIRKLNDIIAKTGTLMSARKITSGGNSIVTSASSVISCLQQ